MTACELRAEFARHRARANAQLAWLAAPPRTVILTGGEYWERAALVRLGWHVLLHAREPAHLEALARTEDRYA